MKRYPLLLSILLVLGSHAALGNQGSGSRKVGPPVVSGKPGAPGSVSGINGTTMPRPAAQPASIPGKQAPK